MMRKVWGRKGYPNAPSDWPPNCARLLIWFAAWKRPGNNMHDSNCASGPANAEKGSPRITTYCCVPQCSTYATENVSFHHFPKDVFDKAKWESALRMGKSASKSMRVCSKHFSPADYIKQGNFIFNFQVF